jgi:hypothetical protein
MSTIIERICASQKRLAKIPDLHQIVTDSDYAFRMCKEIEKSFSKKKPPMWLILGQIEMRLKDDKTIEGIIRSECKKNFIGTEEYNSLIFVCSLFIFVEYVKIQGDERRDGE